MPIVLDCGTGAHDLGLALSQEPPQHGAILISHTHWDHIQGLPFFGPLFQAGGEWDVYGPRGLGSSLEDALAGQMQSTYFPISFEQFEASVRFHDLVEGSFEIDGVRVTTRYLNHPALTLGYRLEEDGASLVYATDHEPHAQQNALAGDRARSREDGQHAAFVAGADLLVHDAQYTAEEYADFAGWGHSPFEFVVDTACAFGVRQLALFHHDPLRDDAALDAIVALARAQAARAGSGLEVFAAEEGLRLEIEAGPQPTAEPATASRAVSVPAVDGTVLLAVEDAESSDALGVAVRGDGLRLITASDAEQVLERAREEQPSVVVLGRSLAGRDALDVADAIRRAWPKPASAPAVVVIAQGEDQVDREAGARVGVLDWLVAPFKPTYARARVHCWLLRTACSWVAAPLPEDEVDRLETLRGMGVLDTPSEERFDRFTRIAAALFDVPVALVSLVDAERQWFKSHHGLDATETPREMAFCAHAILAGKPLVIPDAHRDPRFADNPLVTGPPHVRFYAGVPLRVGGDEGGRGVPVGTLCLIDHRAREIEASKLALLGDMARLVEAELSSGAVSAA
jgi:ribonuclease BN (tRNA processing enzyme)/DNA-binding response OmpR family regulator